MMYGRGFGMGRGRGFGRGFGMGRGGGFGKGFGFQGYSPPWPYVGLGRGGLPRCRAYAYPGMPDPPYTDRSWGYPYGGEAYASCPEAEQGTPSYPQGGFGNYGAAPFAPSMTPEQEIDFLKGQAQMLKDQLDQIDARLSEIEKLR